MSYIPGGKTGFKMFLQATTYIYTPLSFVSAMCNHSNPSPLLQAIVRTAKLVLVPCLTGCFKTTKFCLSRMVSS